MVIIQVVMDTWAKLLLKLVMILFHSTREDKVILKEEDIFMKVKKSCYQTSLNLQRKLKRPLINLFT